VELEEDLLEVEIVDDDLGGEPVAHPRHERRTNAVDRHERLPAADFPAERSWQLKIGRQIGRGLDSQPLDPVFEDVDLVVALDDVDRSVGLLEQAGFKSERFPWSVNLKGRSAVSVQLSTEEFYRDFPNRAVPADVHGILLRVACLADTLVGKIKAWGEPTRRQSKQAKDFTDIVRLVEAHPHLWETLTPALKALVNKPA
jgi:hypothetical protein